MKRTIKYYIPRAIFTVVFLFSSILFTSCSEEITQIFENEITAKDRLAAANEQAVNTYGAETKLVLIFGKNVKSNGTTDISTFSAFTSPDSIGSWLYVYRVPVDSSLRVFAPNPLPGADDCIELTAFFNTDIILSLIADSSARNIVSGALGLITQAQINIETETSALVDSDVSLNYANTSNPIIKFNSAFDPSTSSLNGNVFFSTGTDKTINMFLIPAGGTLNLPNFIEELVGFPHDLWVVNYKKKNTSNVEENLILATVVESDQVMGIPFLNFSSKVINISKFVNQ